MSIHEYLLTFSNEGDLSVKVKFKKSLAKIADRRIDSHQILSLIDPKTGTFMTEMTFDDHPFSVEKYEINPIKKTLIIYAVAV